MKKYYNKQGFARLRIACLYSKPCMKAYKVLFRFRIFWRRSLTWTNPLSIVR